MPTFRANFRFNPRRFLRGLFCALVLVSVGCRNTSKDREELILAELRTRTRELEETRAELMRHRQLNDLYQRQGVPVWGGNPSFRPSTESPTYPLKEITIGRGTGGVDEDGQPGDESFMVMLVPKDDDGTAVKVPGKVSITALEVSPEGLKVPISRWEVTPEQLRRTWKSGLLSSGYGIPLQWERAPAQNRVRVVVRFQTMDGKDFEADKDVTVQVLPGMGIPRSPGPVPPGFAPPSPVIPNMNELPPPGPAAKLLPPQAVK